MLECDVVVHRDIAEVVRAGRGDHDAQLGARAASRRRRSCRREARDAVAAQAAKRVGLEFVELRRASWDHRKLGGVY